jgi:protein translocase SecG subunit
MGSSRVSVLIADDQRLFAEALEAILSTDARIQVVATAGNGQAALELAREHRPQVVLMDIAMPVMDGIEATGAIRSELPGTSVIVLTGSAAAQDVSRARAAGAAGYVTKDQIAGDLVRAILDVVVEWPLRPRATLPGRMVPFFAVIQVLLSAALVGLVLMHSGRDTGLAGMGFTPQSQGGTHIVERNLTRVTIVISVLFFLNCILLFRLLK